MVIDFFKELYGPDSRQREPLLTTCHPSISEVDRIKLENEIQPYEIRLALFQMKPWKAPWVDGFQAGFYQECWDTVGSSLIKLVQQAFISGNFNAHLSPTLLVLIPKVEKPEYTKQFRPISLCTVAYKVITKVLVNRLRPTFYISLCALYGTAGAFDFRSS